MNSEWIRALGEEYRRSIPGKIARLEAIVSSIESLRDDESPVEELRTAVHKLAGSAGSYGFGEIGRIASEWEDRMVTMRDEGRRPGQGELVWMRSAIEAIRVAARTA